MRKEFVPGKNSVKYTQLVGPHLVLLFPLHIKLGQMNFFKALDKNSDSFNYLKQMFPKLCEVKLKISLLVHRLENFHMTAVLKFSIQLAAGLSS
jgi:hypothetical protein